MVRNCRFNTIPVLMLALIASGPALVAQSNTTSALAGRVTDADGSPLGDAVIRATSPALITGERVTKSAENGSYRFPLLPPGRYKVTVEYPGRNTASKTLTLELGSTFSLNWKLTMVAGATVEVIGDSGIVEATTIGVTQNYSTEAIANLPTVRSLSGIMDLTPGVNSNRAWGGDSRENAFMMDGINVGDSMNNTQWIYPNVDWFEEVQVGGIGASAEFGGFTGGFVNGLIKRGGNDYSGSFNAYLADNKWEALTSNDDPRLTAANKALAPAKDWSLSFTVGGPIIRDKVWFFASGERWARENTPIGAPIPSRRNELRLLSKVTWQALPTATLEALIEHDYTSHDRRGITRFMEIDASRKEYSPNHSYGLTWTQSVGNDKVFTLKTLGFSGYYEHKAYNGDVPGLRTSGNWAKKEGEQELNRFYNTHWEDYNGRDRFTVSATFDWFKTGLFSANDSHAFRMGIEHESLTHKELESNPGGLQLWGWVRTIDGVRGVYTDEYMTGGCFNIRLKGTRTSVFLQDVWTVNDRLTLRPGVRFEQQKGNPVGRPTAWDTTTVAPRIGANYSLTQDQKNVVKFHWGRYYSSFVSAYIDRQYEDMITPEATYEWGDPDNDYAPVLIDPFDPRTWPIPDPRTQTPDAVTASMSPTDPNAKQPYMDEFVLSYDRNFSGPWSASVTYTHRKHKDLLARVNTTPDNGEWRDIVFDDYRKGPDGKITIPVWYSSVAADDIRWAVKTVPEGKRAYWSTSIVLKREFKDNWGLTTSYTKARRYGNSTRANGYDTVFQNPNNLTNAYGLLPGYNDDEFKLHGTYELPWLTRVSCTFTYLSGERWTPRVRTASIRGTRYNPYVEPRGSQTYPATKLLDFRVSQGLQMTKKTKAELFVDIFNLLNEGAAYSWEDRINWAANAYKLPDGTEQGRRLRLGFRISF